MLNYSEALRFQRKSAGLTQKELSQATKIPQQTISWSESGQGIPNIEFCVQLADFYGISVDELIGRDFPNDEKHTTVNNSFNGSNILGNIKF